MHEDPDQILMEMEIRRTQAETPPSDPVLAQIWHLDRNLGKIWVRDIGPLQRAVSGIK